MQGEWIGVEQLSWYLLMVHRQEPMIRVSSWRISLIPEALTYALVINDFHYRSKLSILRASVNQDNSANFNQSPLTRFDVGVTHFDVSVQSQLPQLTSP